MFRNLPLVLQEGRRHGGPDAGKPIWTFVGSVPAALAYECSANDPAVVADLMRAAAHSGPAIARGIAERRGLTFRTASWPTEAAALAAAEAIGARVSQVCPADPARWRRLA